MNPVRALPLPRLARRDAARLLAGALALAVAALCVPRWREAVEVSMALQMIVLLPGLFALGAALPCLLPPASRARLAAASRPHALSALTFATLAFGIWMVPIALDLARIEPMTGVAKYALVPLAGLAAHLGLRACAWPVTLFFVGNYVWMTLTFGLIYQEAGRRLCANFLLEDQLVAGRGLVGYAIVIGIGTLAWVARQSVREEREAG
jgi:hypothetical protein